MDIVEQMLKSNAAKGTEALWELMSTLAWLARAGLPNRGTGMWIGVDR